MEPVSAHGCRCRRLVLQLAACAPAGNTEHPKAPYLARLLLSERVEAVEHPSLEKQFPEKCKQPKAIEPQENPGRSPVKTIKMSDVLQLFERWQRRVRVDACATRTEGTIHNV